MNKEEIFTRWQDPTIEKLQQENKDLQQRIDKVTKYLKEREEDNECCSVCSVMSDKLLEILGGKE